MTNSTLTLVALIALVTGCATTGNTSSKTSMEPAAWAVTVEQGIVTDSTPLSVATYPISESSWDVPVTDPSWAGLYVTEPRTDTLGREVREVWLPGNPVALVTVECGSEPVSDVTKLTKGESYYKIHLSCKGI